MPYAGASPTLPVEALLKQPTLISRELVNLVYKRLITDRLFVPGSPEQVAGGAMRYQELESIFVDDDPDEIAEGADFPLSDWSETIKTAPVKQYGFGVRLTNLSIRRNQRDMVSRGMRKLANRMVKFIDSKSMTELTTNAGIQTQAASGLWTAAATDIIGDIGKGQELLEVKDNGYAGFDGATLVLHTKRRDDLLNNTALRNALPREDHQGQIQTGMVAPFLGLREILFTPQIAENVAVLMDTSIAGTVADERPDPTENWQAYDPGPGFRPIYVKVERIGNPSVHTGIFAGRWPAIALIQPDAVVKFTGVA